MMLVKHDGERDPDNTSVMLPEAFCAFDLFYPRLTRYLGRARIGGLEISTPPGEKTLTQGQAAIDDQPVRFRQYEQGTWEPGRFGVQLGNWLFKTKGEAQAAVKTWFYRHAPFGRITDPDSLDLAYALLANHPCYPYLIGDGLLGIVKSLNVQPGAMGKFQFAWGLYAIRSELDAHVPQDSELAVSLKTTAKGFSYTKCFDPQAHDPLDVQIRTVVDACRRTATKLRTDPFKDREFAYALMDGKEVRCAVKGEVVARENCHVDHAGEWPMARIIDTWLAANQDRLFDIEMTTGRGAVLRPRSHDETDFLAWHDQRASLAVLGPVANMSKGSGGYRRQFTAANLRAKGA